MAVEGKGLQLLATRRDHAVPGASPQAAADQCSGIKISRGRLKKDFRIILAF